MNPRFLRSVRMALIAIAGAGTLGITNADASAKYVYKGKSYIYMYPTTGCLTEKMHLSMTIVLPAKLAANLSNQSVTAKSWVINDGLHKFKDTQAKAIAPLQAKFTTNASGQITAWSINSYYYTSNGINILYTTHSNSSGDYSADYNCTPSAIASNFVTGTWKPN
jgi:hypothetical protein